STKGRSLRAGSPRSRYCCAVAYLDRNCCGGVPSDCGDHAFIHELGRASYIFLLSHSANRRPAYHVDGHHPLHPIANTQLHTCSSEVIHYVIIMFGTGCVLLVMVLARALFIDPLDRLLCVLFLLSSGASQLFFGYVENYTPAYFGVILYCLLAILHLRGKIHL